MMTHLGVPRFTLPESSSGERSPGGSMIFTRGGAHTHSSHLVQHQGAMAGYSLPPVMHRSSLASAVGSPLRPDERPVQHRPSPAAQRLAVNTTTTYGTSSSSGSDRSISPVRVQFHANPGSAPTSPTSKTVGDSHLAPSSMVSPRPSRLTVHVGTPQQAMLAAAAGLGNSSPSSASSHSGSTVPTYRHRIHVSTRPPPSANSVSTKSVVPPVGSVVTSHSNLVVSALPNSASPGSASLLDASNLENPDNL
jgi:hypothetical protein